VNGKEVDATLDEVCDMYRAIGSQAGRENRP
jgi:hypothetical protein